MWGVLRVFLGWAELCPGTNKALQLPCDDVQTTAHARTWENRTVRDFWIRSHVWCLDVLMWTVPGSRLGGPWRKSCQVMGESRDVSLVSPTMILMGYLSD